MRHEGTTGSARRTRHPHPAPVPHSVAGHPSCRYTAVHDERIRVVVRALRAPQHSGMFGGVLPDPVQGLAKMLSTLSDARGRLTVSSLLDDVRPLTPAERERLKALVFDPQLYAQAAGLVEGVELIGDPAVSPLERLWMQPAITVIGLDAHPIRGSSNQILSEAAARVTHAITTLGLRVACLFPAMHHVALDDPRIDRTVEAVAAQPGTAVVVHCGVLSVGVRKKLGLPSRFDLSLGDPLAISRLALAHPRVPFIVPHFGAGMLR